MNAVSRLAGHATRMRVADARRDQRRWHETRARFWHLVVVSTFFLTVIGAGVYLGTVMVIGALRASTGQTELTADGRTGRIARSLQDGKLCRYILFDNKTAQAVEDRIARCDDGTSKPKRQTPTTFSWGR
jgi:hypothetical protein